MQCIFCGRKMDQAAVLIGEYQVGSTCAKRTSQMGKGKFSEWLEFLHATAVARDVDVRYREYPEAA